MANVVQPIDAVVMWVDGSSEAFQRGEEKALAEERRKGKTIVHAPARHRDNGELRYLLRSIENNMPWIRHIHVVTNGQRPDYIDFSVKGISQVSHSDIFVNADAVPCFNSFAIDSYLHNINGLTENFIRFSDDFFIGRKVGKEEFLQSQAAFVFRGRVQETPKNRYQRQVKYNAELMEQVLGLRANYNIAHAPQLRNIETCKRFEKTYDKALSYTRSNKFRTSDDLMPLMLYPYYVMLETSPDSIKAMAPGFDTDLVHMPRAAITERYGQVGIGKKNDDWVEKLNKILKVRPLFLNLNDDFGDERKAEGLAEMEAFLNKMFPSPSRFERPSTSGRRSRFFDWFRLMRTST